MRESEATQMRGAKRPLRPLLMSTSQQIEMLGTVLYYSMYISTLPPHSKVNSSFILPCTALVQGSASLSLLYPPASLVGLPTCQEGGGRSSEASPGFHLVIPPLGIHTTLLPPEAACLHTDSLKETSHCHFSFHCSLLCSHSSVVSPPLPLVFLPVSCSFSLM